MNRLKFLAGIFIIILVASCGRYKDIQIGEVQDFEIKGFNKDALVLEIKVPIDNPSVFNIEITEMDARVYINDKYIGKVNSTDTVMLHKKSEEVHDLNMNVRLANFLGSAMKVMNLKKGSQIHLRLEGFMMARVMGLRKKVSFDESKDVVL
ncbi:MAG: hypothetical protein JW801_18620 [Bacteroidales bacterium]|nr:hypothetical protein [Bacteroidales bacterium]